MLAITDFCLLYSAIVILVCEKDENQMYALYFLKQFLQQEIPSRPCELGILFAVLIRQGDAEPHLRRQAVEVLSIICDISPEVCARVETGTEHHDQSLAALCRDALKLKTANHTNSLQVPEFADIPNEATVSVAGDMLNGFCEALSAGSAPVDPISFIRNVIETMRRFCNSPFVLEKGSECLRNAISQCNPIPVELVSHILDLCFTILSGETFLNGDDSFEAVEAVQNLSNAIFETVPAEILLPAVAGTVAETTDSRLPLLLNKLKEYVKFSGAQTDQFQINEIAMALDAFHPTFTGRPDFLVTPIEQPSSYEAMTESIRRLMDPETVFEEMESIVATGDSTIVQSYPVYLRGFLQRAFFLLTEMEPIGMTDHDRQIAQDMMENYKTMTAEDLLPGGKFSIDTLSAQLDEMKSNRIQSW